MTKEELGQSIKAKYPQYNMMDNAELADKIIAKYPVYAEQLDVEQEGETGVKGFALGAGKGALETVQGLGQLGLRGAELISWQDKGEFGSQETFLKDDTALEAKTGAEKAGKFLERVAEFAIPATKATKATKGASFLKKLLTRAGVSGGVGAAQSGEIGQEAGIAAATEAAFPVVGKIAKPFLNASKRIIGNLASGLSGAPASELSAIVKNPEIAKTATKELLKDAKAIIKANAKKIQDGLFKVRQEARKAYGDGLEQLQEVDIEPVKFRQAIQEFLDKYASFLEDGQRVISNIEFDDAKNINKASTLIDKLQNAKLNGKSLRKLIDDIETSKFTTATSDERLAFNKFVQDMANSLKKAVNESTDKLTEINASFSKDMQLVNAMESIFGKAKFKSTAELAKIADRLETLANQKGIKPEQIDEFLTRIGVNADEFNTRQAVSNISNIEARANSQGTSIYEIIRGVTSGVITPKAIRDAATLTGFSEQYLKTVLEPLSPTMRATFIQSIISDMEN